MRVLLINNESSVRCGIREFGRNMLHALRAVGIDVDYFDGHYERIYETKRWLPEHAGDYDVIHLNWHPVTINHYLPEHFPPGPLLSVYVGDLPPWSSCPLWARAQVRFAAEDFPGTTRLIYPCPDYRPITFARWPPVLIGYSSVRQDGVAQLTEVCARNGWRLNAPEPVWLTVEEELERLARSTVNVAWYENARGISGGVMVLASARRPLIVNRSPMFAHLLERDDLIVGDDMEAAIRQGLQEMRRPRIADDFAWSTYGIPILLKAWGAAQAERNRREF